MTSFGSKGVNYKEEISLLNQDFLSSLQNAIQKSPHDCFAPLAMDYLQFMYIILQQQNSTNNSSGKIDPGSIDFLTVANFFQEMKDKFTSSSSNTANMTTIALPSTSSSSLSTFSFGPSIKNVNNGNTTTTTSTSLANNSTRGFSQTLPVTTTTKTLPPASSTFSFGLPTPNNNNTGGIKSNLNGISYPTTTTTTTNFSSFGSTSTTTSTTTGGKLQNLPSPSSLFSFGTSNNSSTFSSATTSSSTTSNTTAAPSSAFSMSAPLSSSSTFSFQIKPPQQQQASVNGTKEDSDDDNEPPKPDHTPIVESDALYTKRVKLFEMVDKTYKDKGVGNLFIKQLSSGKSQAVIRADNSLGTILFNVVLNSAIALKLNPPNNILTTVPGTDKSSTFVIRVKTNDEATELLSTLEKYKN